MNFNKSIIVNKTNYNIVDNMRLEAYLQRINKYKYDVKIVEDDNKYNIIVTPKIERV